MDLPIEIRERIWEMVINGKNYPDVSSIKSYMEDEGDSGYSCIWSHNLNPIAEYDRDILCPNCLPLLLTSRQISGETKGVLNRMRTTDFTLEISVLNDKDLVWTWTSVPQLTTRISTLIVNIRLYGHMFRYRDLPHPVGAGMHDSLYGLLRGFLRNKPWAPKGGKPSSKGPQISIQNLVLDFHSAKTELPFPPANIGYDEWNTHVDSLGMNNPFEFVEPLVHKSRPEWLLRWLNMWIHGITVYHIWDYGYLLYEHIGSLSMMIDGQLSSTIDLADRLAEVEIADEWHTADIGSKQHRLIRWKRTALAKRMAFGLSVV